MEDIKISQVVEFLEDRVKYAEIELDERCENGTDYDVQYWANYRDGVSGTLLAFKKKYCN